jgi:hypothetical protein
MPRPTHQALFLVVFFLGIIVTPPLIQTAVELRRNGSVQCLDVFRHKPTAANLRAYERELEDSSRVARALRGWAQEGEFILLKEAGDKALVGRDGWLFYKPGFRYLVERAPAPAASSSNSPRAAIVAFRDQLAARGVHLVVVPAPNKESVYPEKLSGRASGAGFVLSSQTRQLLQDLRSAGVEVVDLFETYRAAKKAAASGPSVAFYLAQDSHWSPAGVELAAQTVAERILGRGWVAKGTVAYDLEPAAVRRTGDVLRMLQTPALEQRIAPEEFPCQRVVRQGRREPYRDDGDSEILVLGDSFLRIYEQDEPGAAGFIAHLALALGQPVTSIVNDGGASTLVRQQLYQRPGLLKNKKVVVWEFVERDIRFGTEGWQLVPLPPAHGPGQRAPAKP